MIDTIYVEQDMREHPRSVALLARFPHAQVVACHHYGEVFNRANQHFRVQKQRPALILAHKPNRRILPVPDGYAIDGSSGHYFSHMLNCLYDCRYCFLQGMFRSAHYVLFVNYEDFVADARALCAATDRPTWFFSGYDCDSLALEPVTGFAAEVVPAFAAIGNAWLELRTKSTQVRALLAMPPAARVVCAFSLNPPRVAEAFEHRAPSLAARLDALVRVADHGWPIALRLDPLILVEDFRAVYGAFFETVFTALGERALHSITLGSFRLPRDYYKRIARLYPEEPLLAGHLETHAGSVGYAPDDERQMLDWCQTRIAALHGNTPVFIQGAATP